MPAITPILTPACTFRYVTVGSRRFLVALATTGLAAFAGACVALVLLGVVTFGVVDLGVTAVVPVLVRSASVPVVDAGLGGTIAMPCAASVDAGCDKENGALVDLMGVAGWVGTTGGTE